MQSEHRDAVMVERYDGETPQWRDSTALQKNEVMTL
jgi:hypothetical protein